MISLAFSILAALFLSPTTQALTLDQLRHRSIYQVLTDRFARHDGQTPYCDTGAREYCGGTWKGIEGRLGYIQDMGFDTGESYSLGCGVRLM
jgi:alpha-amylase